MTEAQMLAAIKQVNKTVKANADRCPATRPLMDRSQCTNPGCTACARKPGRR